VTDRASCGLVLIIDRDLGFLMWLGELFAELGCQAVPALRCRDALALARRLELPITTLVINPELRGARRLVKILLATNSDVLVVSIVDSADHRSSPLPSPDGFQSRFTFERPAPWEPISRWEWLARVRKTLSMAAGRPS
jgi:hypothetical protein